MKIANEFFSWFQYELICSDVRALNATFYGHSTPNSIICKGYCSWRSKRMGAFSWFKHESICLAVRALNATFLVHSTSNSIIGKGYCVWRLQICYLADSTTNSYVLMLERWMLSFSYIQRQIVLLVRNIVHQDHQGVF